MMTYRQIYESDPAFWKSIANVKATYLRALVKLRLMDKVYELREMAIAMRMERQ
jgi:hypothetical protein